MVYQGRTDYFLWADERIGRGKVILPDPIMARIIDNNNLPVFLTLYPIQVMISETPR